MTSAVNLVVGTPCYGGLVTHVYVHSLLKLMVYASARGIGVGLRTAAHDSLVPRARNGVVAAFLDDPSATHLLFIDADTGFEPEHVGRLLDFGEDVVAGMYPIKSIDWAQAARRSAEGALTAEGLREAGLHYVGVPCAPGQDGEREERDGFVTAEYAGTGFMLIRRAAIERLAAAYPATKYRTMHTYPEPRARDHLYGLFDCLIEPETRTYLSEDFAFCHRWRRIGGKVWLDTRSRLRHVGACEYVGTPAFEGR